jgi:hypothetical protein
MKPGKMHAPQDIQEILVLLSWILLESPQFIEKSGYFQSMSVDYVFGRLKEGLGNIRETLGEQRYQELMRMSDRMQAHFEADPESKTGETRKGRDIVYDMEDILRQVRGNS